MKYHWIPLLVLFTADVTAFLSPNTNQRAVLSQKRNLNSFSNVIGEKVSYTKLANTSVSAKAVILDEHDEHDEQGLLKSSIFVGLVTAAMGFFYGKILSKSVQTVWTTIPQIILQKYGSIDPRVFITTVCTLGGLSMGVLSKKFPSAFTVADFVHSYSGDEVKALPSSKTNLLPVLLLSLVTSTFGFSVGPEAPMVCAGALIGSSIARYLYGSTASGIQETLAYAGAAGALTAFMGIPIAGSIFALELTRANAGMTKSAGKTLAPATMASIAALILIRGVFLPGKEVGGHFVYDAVGYLSGSAMIQTSVVCGLIGGAIGTLFHKAVHFLKSFFWSQSTTIQKSKSWKNPILVKSLIGLIVGLISVNYPQTLFWGEGSLQIIVDGQKTAFASTKHGLSSALTSMAKVDPSIPFGSASAALQVGVAKLVAIALACSGKFPGGIIFPLFFASGSIAHAIGLSMSNSIVPVIVFCLMGATQASVTRTPLATVLMLSLTASSSSELSLLMPCCMISSYIGVFVSRFISKESYFAYNE